MSLKSQGITIRKATENDVAEIIACLSAAFARYKAEYTSDAFQDTVPNTEGIIGRLKNMTIFVSEVSPARIVGTVTCQVVGFGEGHVRGMAVIPEYQGYGVADRLLLAAERELQDSGCSRVTLDTTQPLKRAVNFYLRNGYRATGNMNDYFGMPLFEYEKTLNTETA